MTGQVASSSAIDRQAIADAWPVIAPHIRRTPVIDVPGDDFGLGDCTVVVKMEFLQHSGSFKARGAFANLLMRDVPDAGVVAASGGNHGAAVAYASMRRRVPAKIFVPNVSSPAKVARIREYGADLVIAGDRYADALAASETWAETTGALSVHAFDQRETLLGQGTLGAELDEQADDIDTILVAVGGGGLLGGIAAWFGGAVAVVGVEPEGAPTLTNALEAGEPVDADTGSIAADSLAPKRVGRLMFPIAQQWANRVELVPDAAIVAAQRALWDVLRVVVEPAGATALAALLARRFVPRPGERVAIIVSGANTEAVTPQGACREHTSR